MKRLVLDIEVAPLTIYSWALKVNGYLPHTNIIEDGFILTWAAKWVGKDKIYSDTLYKSGHKKMIQNMANLLEEADVVIGYNSTRFDMPLLQQEMFLLNMPVVEYKQIDLLRVVRRNFRFASASLGYVSKKLGIRKGKMETGGFQLWKDCMAGKRNAYVKMRAYNEEDVVLTELLYLKLLPYITNHPNWNIYTDDNRLHCPTCGSTRVNKKGLRYNKTNTVQRWHCQQCGAHSQSNVIVNRLTKESLR
jgi:DNA polymerase elongation subunit (family B)